MSFHKCLLLLKEDETNLNPLPRTTSGTGLFTPISTKTGINNTSFNSEYQSNVIRYTCHNYTYIIYTIYSKQCSVPALVLTQCSEQQGVCLFKIILNTCVWTQQNGLYPRSRILCDTLCGTWCSNDCVRKTYNITSEKENVHHVAR